MNPLIMSNLKTSLNPSSVGDAIAVKSIQTLKLKSKTNRCSQFHATQEGDLPNIQDKVCDMEQWTNPGSMRIRAFYEDGSSIHKDKFFIKDSSTIVGHEVRKTNSYTSVGAASVLTHSDIHHIDLEITCLDNKNAKIKRFCKLQTKCEHSFKNWIQA